MAESPDDYLTLPQATDYYTRETRHQPGPQFLRRRALAGEIAYFRPSSHVFLIRRADLDAFIRRSRVPAQT